MPTHPLLLPPSPEPRPRPLPLRFPRPNQSLKSGHRSPPAAVPERGPSVWPERRWLLATEGGRLLAGVGLRLSSAVLAAVCRPTPLV